MTRDARVRTRRDVMATRASHCSVRHSPETETYVFEIFIDSRKCLKLFEATLVRLVTIMAIQVPGTP